MNRVCAQFCSMFCIAAIVGGLGLLSQRPASQLLSQDEAMAISGGTLNPLNLTNTDCPAATADCSFEECDNNNACPAGKSMRYQLRANYPSGTEAGTAWETTKAKDYDCNYARACSNPCSQSTVTNKWYCGGPVGPNIALPPVAGIEGDKAAATEA